MSGSEKFLKTPCWYLPLSDYSLETKFVKLRPSAVEYLASGAGITEDVDLQSEVSKQVISELAAPMRSLPGNCFVSVDCCAPTDTERFADKGGAVYSPESAWRFLCKSAKVSAAAAAGQVEFICVRPFRRITKAREFRLFICDGELKAMSQYNLDRHYRRLEGVKESYWDLAVDFVRAVNWKLEIKTLVIDIYITGDEDILIMDLNQWGGTTDPLMMRTWERDWNICSGIVLMDPPVKIGGDVKVSF